MTTNIDASVTLSVVCGDEQRANLLLALLSVKFPANPMKLVSAPATDPWLGQQDFGVVIVDAESAEVVHRCLPSLHHHPCLWLLVNLPDWHMESVGLYLQRGYLGAIPVSACAEQLTRAVNAVVNDELWFPRKVLASFLKGINNRWPSPEKLALAISSRYMLTSKEKRVCQLMLEGKSNKQIAENNHVSINTIKTQVSHIMGKLGINSRSELAARAMDSIKED